MSEQEPNHSGGNPRVQALTLTLLLLVLAGVAYWQYSTFPLKPAASGTIVVILVDTLRADSLGSYGNSLPVTPNLDALAQDGVLFRQAMSTSCWTLPAAASLVTGTWPTIHGALGKGVSHSPIRPDVKVASELFKEAGFRTFGLGNAMFVRPELGFARGFDQFDFDMAFAGDARTADVCVDAAIAQLEQHKDQPQYIFLHLFDPHLSYKPPAGFQGKFAEPDPEKMPPLSWRDCVNWPGQKQAIAGPQKRGQMEELPPPAHLEYVRNTYLEEVHFLDAQLGRLFQALRDLDLYNDATIVLTADHGEEFWEHGAFEHGHTLYDELIHVPLIIKLPDQITPARKSLEEQVRIIDVMPTLFDMCAIPLPSTFLGASLMPLINGEKETEERFTLSESTLYGHEQISLRMGGRKLHVNLSEGTQPPVFEYYDLASDPAEQKNLIQERPEEAAQMIKTLHQYTVVMREEARKLAPTAPIDLSPDEVQTLESLGYIR